jgi:hypothetical protein
MVVTAVRFAENWQIGGTHCIDMLFTGRDSNGKSTKIRTIREVVEVVAILAAGFWAFYVFIYENRIKPLFSQPEINVSATMEKTSRHAGQSAFA